MDEKIKTNDYNDHSNLNKKSLLIITFLIIIGIITGLILSSYFLSDANQKISDWNTRMDEWYAKWENSSWHNYSWSNNTEFNNTIYQNNSNFNTSSNHETFNWSDYDPYLKPLSTNDVILHTITVILLCINSYILLGLIFTYLKIFKESKSKYILSLVFVLIPLFIVSLLFIRLLKSLFMASSFQYDTISLIFGFGIEGLGGIISILTVFEIIGLSILLYLSRE